MSAAVRGLCAVAVVDGRTVPAGASVYELRVSGRALARYPHATTAALAQIDACEPLPVAMGASGGPTRPVEVVPVRVGTAGTHGAAVPDTDLLEAAAERLANGERVQGDNPDTGYVECPGCAKLVHREDQAAHAGAGGCVALLALVAWEMGVHPRAAINAAGAVAR